MGGRPDVGLDAPDADLDPLFEITGEPGYDHIGGDQPVKIDKFRHADADRKASACAQLGTQVRQNRGELAAQTGRSERRLSRKDLPEQHINARQRDGQNSRLGTADVDAGRYPRSLSSAHERTALLLPPGASVVVDHGSGRVEVVGEVQGAELTGDRDGPAVARRRSDCGPQDIDDVNVVLEVDGG